MNEKKQKKTNLIFLIPNKVFRFFIPKNFGDELLKGRIIGEQLKQGALSPKVIPTYWIGKGLRKLIDPKHTMKIGKNKNE